MNNFMRIGCCVISKTKMRSSKLLNKIESNRIVRTWRSKIDYKIYSATKTTKFEIYIASAIVEMHKQ
jgi:hypothetical protein